MSADGHSYTPCGFSSEIDWRPVHFVEPLPSYRVCSACGLVPKTAALLPCRHVLCQPCYEQCVVDSGHACPLDGDGWQENDVDWRDFPAENLMKRQVWCWNKATGCDAVLAAADIAKHFHSECGHRPATCPKCSITVLRSSACSHLKECPGELIPSVSSKQTPEETGSAVGKHVEQYLLGIQAAVQNASTKTDMAMHSVQMEMKKIGQTLKDALNLKEQQRAMHSPEFADSIGEVKTLLDAQCDKLKRLADDVDATKETFMNTLSNLTEELREICLRSTTVFQTGQEQQMAGLRELRETLEEGLSEVEAGQRQHFVESNALREQQSVLSRDIAVLRRALVQEVRELARQNAESLEHNTDYLLKKCQESLLCARNVCCARDFPKAHCWLLKECDSLKRVAAKEWVAVRESERVYLGGYCVSSGVFLQNDGNTFSLHFIIQLHKGDLDDLLEWPFQHKIRLGIVHQKTSKFRKMGFQPGLERLECFSKPTSSSNDPLYFWQHSFDWKNLEDDGYVKHDQLLLKCELIF